MNIARESVRRQGRARAGEGIQKGNTKGGTPWGERPCICFHSSLFFRISARIAAFLRSCKYWKHVNEVICPWERSVVPTPENDLFPKPGPGDPPFSLGELGVSGVALEKLTVFLGRAAH